MTDEDIINASTTEELRDLLLGYCVTHSLTYQSADEMLVDLLHRIEKMKRHTDWLNTFIMKWDIVQHIEDSAECKRNGHRDTGRNMCAVCGEFI